MQALLVPTTSAWIFAADETRAMVEDAEVRDREDGFASTAPALVPARSGFRAQTSGLNF